MMKRILTLLVLVAAVGYTASAQRIAVIDIQEILSNMKEYSSAEKQLDDLAAEWRQEVSIEYDKIKSLYNKYQAEQVLLSDADKKKREDEIVEAEAAVRELQKRKFGPEGDLFLKRQELVAPVQEKVFSAIEDFAADRGYDLIFDKAGSTGLLFTSDEYDKTVDLKKRLGVK
ncbi:OmpH family outer membrane protein [Saprospiraceae bacterium]|jgi:outer membrane protein|nr:OmpH family outer membrane protein [Saprospiraceae bacterium]